MVLTSQDVAELMVDFPNHIKRRLELRLEREAVVGQVIDTPEDISNTIDANGGIVAVRKLIGGVEQTPNTVLMDIVYKYITNKANAEVILTITNANTILKTDVDKKLLVSYVAADPVSLMCKEWSPYLIGSLSAKPNRHRVRAVWPHVVDGDIATNYVAFGAVNGFGPRTGIDTPYLVKKIDIDFVVRVAQICPGGLGALIASKLPFTKCYDCINHSAGTGRSALFDEMFTSDEFRLIYDVLPSSIVGKHLLATMIKLNSFGDNDARREFLSNQLDPDGDVAQQHFAIGVNHFFKNRERVSVDNMRGSIFSDVNMPCPCSAYGCVVCISRDIDADDEKHDDITLLVEAYTGKKNGKRHSPVVGSRNLSERQIKLVKTHLCKKKKRKRKTTTTTSTKVRKVVVK
jgi:hypothetical protein